MSQLDPQLADARQPTSPNHAAPGRRNVLFRGVRRFEGLAARVGRGIRAASRALSVRFPRLVSLYYAICDDTFRREHRAVLAGTAQYSRDLDTPGESSALLRRNVHRIEKGLLMVPRRKCFAVEYIDETVACYERVHAKYCGTSSDGETELRWAHDVLSQYFSIANGDPAIDVARRRFQALPDHTCGREPQLVPYCRDVTSPPPVDYQALWQLARRRRSVRWFLKKPVPREMIDRAIALAGQSPTACNRQPYVIRIFDQPDLVQKVANIPMGTAGYAHNIPVMAVIVGQLRNYFSERDRHLIYIDGSLAAMGLVYALECQGLSTCCINWPDIEEREKTMATLLELEPDERPIMCLAIGYPDPEGKVAYSQKKPVGQLRRYNFE